MGRFVNRQNRTRIAVVSFFFIIINSILIYSSFNKPNMAKRIITKDVTIEVTSPVKCTDEQFKEWIYFETGYSAVIDLNNPLSDYDLEADDVSID